MRTFLFLTRFFALKRLLSGTALLLALLAAFLVLAGFLSTTHMIESFASTYAHRSGGVTFEIPVQVLEKGSVHGQVWEATSFSYLHRYPIIGGALLPFRNVSLWLFIMLPFVGLLLSACEVSGELESGVALTLYGAPTARSVLGISRILGDSLAVSALISIGTLSALAVGSRIVGYEVSGVHWARSAVFVLILGFYTSLFVQVGNLISSLSRRSVRSLWFSVTVGLLLIGSFAAGDNLMNAMHEPYESIPLPPLEVNRIVRSQERDAVATKSDAELLALGGPEFVQHQQTLASHASQFHDRIRNDYQQERWYALISPIHAIWEVAQQMLQDRHNASTEIFAPLAAMDPPPSIRRSLAEAWPELAGMVFVWLVLFAINVRVLSRLEV